MPMKEDNRPKWKFLSNRIWLLAGGLALILLIIIGFAIWYPNQKQPEMISLSEIASGISSGQITKIEDTLNGGELTVYYKDGSMKKGMRDPNSSLLEQLNLLGLKQNQLASVQYKINRNTAAVGNPIGLLLFFGVIGIAGFIAVKTNPAERWGKKSYAAETDIPAVRFKHVAGLDENLQELQDIVTFLKDGSKFAEMGATMPRGILMVGDPGTGKTLIAKAIAGEAGVPFFATSGSEFSEVFVGVGASRIRALFKKARKKSPCIIFIDEIDAVGRSRHRSESGAEMEQDQTLNQLLVEMDGFDRSENIIVLAATNRADVLDSALTRAGRFDRRLYINRPDIKGREAILDIHSRGKKLAANVSLANVARATPGLVGADLAAIVNEAAILAVRNNHTEICKTDFDEAIEKTLTGGVQRKNYVMSEDEKKIVAYHEAGHAVVIHETKQDPVYKITIIPRGQMGGFTMSLPDQDRLLISRCKILARITGLLGGRAAEEIFFQDITSGASNDLNEATQIAEEMVMRLGMDRRAGLRVFPQNGHYAFLGLQGSQKTHETIDQAVNNILEGCYSDARKIVTEKRDCLERIANKLLEVETLDRTQFEALMEL